MTENATNPAGVDSAVIEKRLAKRYRTETIFRMSGFAAIIFAVLCLGFLIVDIVGKGASAFFQHAVQLEIDYDMAVLGIADENELAQGNYLALVRKALLAQHPEVSGRKAKKELYRLVSSDAEYRLRDTLMAQPELLGTRQNYWFLVDDDVDIYLKTSEQARASLGRLSERQTGWLNNLEVEGKLREQWNTAFWQSGDSREPEMAGMRGAMIGSFLTLLVTLLISFPVGIGAAVYLEEFAPANRWTELIEVNINNLAAVPSIIFGLLGLAIFINFAGLPRSAPLVGGLVLSLMSLPTIIISSRASIKAVPPSLREAALGLGASQMQTVFHHVLPAAMPGMLTGTIIAMAQALGETAPLLMIGMVAFIADIPGGITDSATVLPVQIYLWADSPERSFIALTSAAIMVLLVFLIAMNTLAIILRKRLERRW
jgi:phosphate transport system permease protein